MFRILLSFLLLLGTPLISLAQTDYQGIVDKLIGEVHSAKLSNGLQVIIYPRKQAPVFSAVISVKVGGVDEIPGKTGISHMLEHMAFKGSKTLGTKNFPKEAQLLRELEVLVKKSQDPSEDQESIKKQISIVNKKLKKTWNGEEGIDQIFSKLGGVGMNASTSSDFTNYFISMPSNALESWCQIESDRLAEPVWRQFYSERDVVQEERRLRYVDDPDGALYIKMLANAYELHPYRRPTIGYETDLNNLTANDIDQFYRTYYQADNILITLVGDLDVSDTVKMLEKYFSSLPSQPTPKRTNIIEPWFTGKKEFAVQFAAEPRMLLAYHKPNYPNPDDLALNLWLDAMLGSSVAPIYKDLVIDRSIARSLSYFEGPGAAFPNLYLIFAQPIAPTTNDQLEAELLKIIEAKLKAGISESDLNLVKKRLKADLIFGLQSNMTLAQGLSYAQHVYDDWHDYFSWLAKIDNLDIATINQVARKYLVPENLIVGKLEDRQ